MRSLAGRFFCFIVRRLVDLGAVLAHAVAAFHGETLEPIEDVERDGFAAADGSGVLSSASCYASAVCQHAALFAVVGIIAVLSNTLAPREPAAASTEEEDAEGGITQTLSPHVLGETRLGVRATRAAAAAARRTASSTGILGQKRDLAEFGAVVFQRAKPY
jgi:hypothetical protein